MSPIVHYIPVHLVTLSTFKTITTHNTSCIWTSALQVLHLPEVYSPPWQLQHRNMKIIRSGNAELDDPFSFRLVLGAPNVGFNLISFSWGQMSLSARLHQSSNCMCCWLVKWTEFSIVREIHYLWFSNVYPNYYITYILEYISLIFQFMFQLWFGFKYLLSKCLKF